jgi:S1-C subfamily serine protease
MIEDGYYPIGISQFSGQKGDPKDAVSHGVSLHAAAVVLYDRSDGAAASDARCVATYWQKTKPPMLGLAVLDMPTETQRKAGRRAGAVVAVVVRNSPAFYAGLAQGDIITRIGNHEVLNAEDFRSAYPAFAGRETEIRFLRNNRKNSVKVNFGTE